MIFTFAEFTFINLHLDAIASNLLTAVHYSTDASFAEEMGPFCCSFVGDFEFMYNFSIGEALRPQVDKLKNKFQRNFAIN